MHKRQLTFGFLQQLFKELAFCLSFRSELVPERKGYKYTAIFLICQDLAHFFLTLFLIPFFRAALNNLAANTHRKPMPCRRVAFSKRGENIRLGFHMSKFFMQSFVVFSSLLLLHGCA